MPTKKTEPAAPVPKKTVAKTVAKKAAKKAVPKKAAVAATKTAGESPLVYAENERSFWVADGQVLNSLVALKEALAGMNATIYAAHVSGRKNDFANWVGVVLKDGVCAKDLLGAKTPASAKTVVMRHLKNYRY